MMKFKEGASIVTSGFWYDITDGGYIKPENLLEDPNEAKAVNDAIALLMKFRTDAESQGIVEEI